MKKFNEWVAQKNIYLEMTHPAEHYPVFNQLVRPAIDIEKIARNIKTKQQVDDTDLSEILKQTRIYINAFVNLQQEPINFFKGQPDVWSSIESRATQMVTNLNYIVQDMDANPLKYKLDDRYSDFQKTSNGADVLNNYSSEIIKSINSIKMRASKLFSN